MKFRPGLAIGWTAAILVAAFQTFGAVTKFIPVAPGSVTEAMRAGLGLTPEIAFWLGIVEIVTVIFFLWPRGSTVGFILMVGYFSGVYATMLTHGLGNIGAPGMSIVFLLLIVSAWFRNPELLHRLTRGKA